MVPAIVPGPCTLRSGGTRRELGWTEDAFNAGDEFELSIENLLVKEKQRTESLILSRGGDVQDRSEVAEEGSDFGLAHLFWVPLLVEKHVSPDPIEIRLLCAKAVMLLPREMATQ